MALGGWNRLWGAPMFNPFGDKSYEFLYPSARRKDDPGWGWLQLLAVAALTTAARVVFGPLGAVVALVLAVLALIVWRRRRRFRMERVPRR